MFITSGGGGVGAEGVGGVGEGGERGRLHARSITVWAALRGAGG